MPTAGGSALSGSRRVEANRSRTGIFRHRGSGARACCRPRRLRLAVPARRGPIPKGPSLRRLAPSRGPPATLARFDAISSDSWSGLVRFGRWHWARSLADSRCRGDDRSYQAGAFPQNGTPPSPKSREHQIETALRIELTGGPSSFWAPSRPRAPTTAASRRAAQQPRPPRRRSSRTNQPFSPGMPRELVARRRVCARRSPRASRSGRARPGRARAPWRARRRQRFSARDARSVWRSMRRRAAPCPRCAAASGRAFFSAALDGGEHLAPEAAQDQLRHALDPRRARLGRRACSRAISSSVRLPSTLNGGRSISRARASRTR